MNDIMGKEREVTILNIDEEDFFIKKYMTLIYLKYNN